jgi:hypothetical protein
VAMDSVDVGERSVGRTEVGGGSIDHLGIPYRSIYSGQIGGRNIQPS